MTREELDARIATLEKEREETDDPLRLMTINDQLGLLYQQRANLRVSS